MMKVLIVTVIKQHLVEQTRNRCGGATGTPTTSTSTINNVSFTSGYSASEIDHDSGDILYIENRAPITRAC